MREYELVDVDDNRPNIRQPASIQSAKLCREENLDEYVIVFLAPGPGNSPSRPVKAISPETGLRVPRNVGGMAPPCEFTAPGPGLSVEIITDTEQFNEENNISGDSPPEMPEVEFGSRVVGNNGDTDPSGITFEWTMELSYDEGNYEDIAEDTTVTLTETVDGDTSWQPNFSQLPGNTPVGGNIEVTVNASQGQGQSSLSDTDVRDGYMIRGENPTETVLEDYIESESDDTLSPDDEIDRALKAMVWHESAGVDYVGAVDGVPNDHDPMQFAEFSGSDHDATNAIDDMRYETTPHWWDENQPAFPLVAPRTGDHGWGLTQLTWCPEFPDRCLLNRDRVWNWTENLNKGIEHFDQQFTGGVNEIAAMYSERDQNANELEELAELYRAAGNEERANELEETAQILRWTWNPQNHDNEEDEYNLRQNLNELSSAIELANDELPIELPDLDPRSDDDEDREETHFHEQPIFRAVAYQAYFRYNAGPNPLFDNYGILLRNLSSGEDPHVPGGPNLVAYIPEYENEPWED